MSFQLIEYPDKDLLKSVALDFEKLLEEGDNEEAVHQFLNNNRWILGFISERTGYGYGEFMVESKFKLADSFVTDFVMLGFVYENDPRPIIWFIEIERPRMPLFTKNGDPSSGLTHAIRQVQNWKQWVQLNRSYLHSRIIQMVVEDSGLTASIAKYIRVLRRGSSIAERLAHGMREYYFVVAGRRTSMTVANRLLLAQMNQDLQGIGIFTYDSILERLLAKATHGWPVQEWPF